MAPMRVFVAANIGPDIREALARLQAALRAGAPGADVGWVRPEGIHVTLKFLGEVAEERIPGVTDALRTALEGQGPFALRCRGTGAFPNLRRPRVVWAGIGSGGEELAGIQSRVEATLLPLGFPPEGRAFTPHLTLGRVRSPKHTDLLARAIGRFEGEAFGEIVVDRIDLMRSELKPSGAVYSVVEAFPLSRPAKPPGAGNG